MDQLKDQVAIVTGASGGLGKTIAEAYAAEGAKVVLASRNVANLDGAVKTIEDAGGRALAVECDVRSEADIVALFETTKAEFGRLDILVNNAGITTNLPTDEIDLETWQNILSVNVTGSFLCAREALKIMKPQKSGRIINIGSIAAKTPRPNSAPYTTTKHALEGLTRSLARDGREFGIAASIITLGATDTGQGFGGARKNERTGDGYWMEAVDIGRIAVMIAALPQMANIYDLTVLPVDQPSFIGRG